MNTDRGIELAASRDEDEFYSELLRSQGANWREGLGMNKHDDLTARLRKIVEDEDLTVTFAAGLQLAVAVSVSIFPSKEVAANAIAETVVMLLSKLPDDFKDLDTPAPSGG